MSDEERPLLPADQQVWLEGPVELIDGKLTLSIPLSEGGPNCKRAPVLFRTSRTTV